MSMQFSEKADRLDVRYIAGLARIALTEEEARQLQGQLDKIVAFVGELKSLDVATVAATDLAMEAGNVWREDEPAAGLDPAAALANAPQARQGHFVVPKVIE